MAAAIEDEEAEDSKDDGNKQLVLHADFDDENSEDDEDFVPGGSESDASDGDTEELDQEVQALEDDDQELDLKPQQQEESSIKEVIEPCLTDVKDAATRAHIRKLHAAFPKAKLSVCKFVLSGSDYDMGEAYEALARGFRPVKPKSAFTEILQDHNQPLVPKTRTKASTAPIKESEDSDSMQVDMDESPNPLVDYYDKNGLPPGSITSGRALSFMADALKSLPARRQSDSSRSSIEGNKSVRFAVDGRLSNELTSTLFIDKQSENDQSSDEDDSDDSDEESSSSDGESSSADSASSQEEDKDEASSSDSDSDSSSESSSSEEEPEEISSKSNIGAVHKTSEVPTSKSEAGAPKPVPTQHVAHPGGGKKATQKRNQRRQKANILNRFKEKGILPAGTTLAEFSELDLEQLSSSEIASAALDKLRAARQAANITDGTSRALTNADEFEKRRQDLLSSLGRGGVEVSSSTAAGLENQPAACDSRASKEDRTKKATTLEIGKESLISPSKEQTPKKTTEENMDVMDVDNGTKLSSVPEVAKAALPVTSRPPRRKLDVGAGRRMLFASLGIKPPKTKQDEDKVRQDLMKDVRPLVTPKPVEPQVVSTEVGDEDPDAWKAKITYRAVECVEEGVELSEPPFPFVQRWDPQQQKSWPYTGGRGGKRKKDQRDQSQYYDDSRASKKQKRRKGKHNYAEEHDYQEEPFELSYDDISIQHDGSILHGNNREGDNGRQMNNDTQGISSPVDLAVLPADPSTLPDLGNGAALVGMTIAFKCLEMNAATQWQPQVSPYRTAIVISIKDGGVLQLSLAKRDRAPAKVYDDETGERIYDKFEMPDDDEVDEDEGILNLSFPELLEPKIVQEPPSNIIDMDMEESTPSKDMPKFDTSAILSSEEDPAEAQFSHVTETVLSSDAPELTPIERALELCKQLAPGDIPESKALQTQITEEPISTQEALEIMNDILKEIPKSPVVQTHDTPMADVLTDEEHKVTPSTPAARAQSLMSIGVLTPSQQISEENRKAISHLMKDAGFRSSIPSSIVRGMNGAADSPSDASAFEKPINDTSETPRETPYSPKFNGLGSSPPMSHAKPAKRIVLESSPAPEQQSRHELGSSTKAHSSWETIDLSLESPAPSSAGNVGNLEHGTEKISGAHMSPSSPTPEPVRQVPERVPTGQVPLGRAQALWESLQPKSRRTSNDSSIGSEDISQEVSLTHAAPEEKDSNTSVQYPKLSVSSSFASQIADHGRQPDYDFRDSTATNSGKSSSFKDSQHRNLESDKASVNSVSKATESNRRDPLSNSDPELPTRNSINSRTNNTSRVSAGLEDTSLDEFPTLMTLSQQALSIKPEQTAPAPPKSKMERTVKKPLEVMNEGIADEDHETTPKPSQKQRHASQNRFAKGKETEKPASQSRSTSSRPCQARPSQSQSLVQQGSQLLIDLTQSSDMEHEPPAPEVDSKFKMNDLDDNDEPTGWVSKKGTTLHGLGGGRRQTGNAINNSSQADLNARDRRRTTGR